MRDLFRTSGVQADDPLINWDDHDPAPFWGNLPHAWFSDAGEQQLVPLARPWLPMYPRALLVPLSEERQGVYLGRYAARSHLSGWLVQTKSRPYTAHPSFAAQLLRTHQPMKMVENGDWQLIWFEYRAPYAAQDTSGRDAGELFPGQP